MAYEKLFEEVEICGQKIRNRYVAAPLNFLNSSFNGYDGVANEEDIAYNVARAMGGVGLIVYGAVLCTELGIKVQNHIWPFLSNETQVAGFSQMTEAIQFCGAKVVIQVLPASGSRGRPISPGEQAVAPTGGIPYPWGGVANVTPIGGMLRERLGPWLAKEILEVDPPRELSFDEIQKIISDTAQSARLAVFAGFDGIELHACHHYLIDQFRDPTLNKRTDKYGGSPENRNRIIVELVDAILKAGKAERPDFIVGVRVGCEQATSFMGAPYNGYTFEETKALAKQLEAMGLDYFHATIALPPSVRREEGLESKKTVLGPEDEDGQLLNYSKELKSVLKIPVMTPYLRNPELAEKAVKEGMTDMVALGRPLMADPEFVNKVKEGRVGEINQCKKEAFCIVRQVMKLPGRCFVNPELGREKYNPKYQITRGFTGADILPPVVRKKPKKPAK